MPAGAQWMPVIVQPFTAQTADEGVLDSTAIQVVAKLLENTSKFAWVQVYVENCMCSVFAVLVLHAA